MKWTVRVFLRFSHLAVFNSKLTYGNKIQTQLNSTCHTISVRKLLQIIVNFDGLTFMTALVVGPFLTSGQN